jgi:integrase
MTTKAASLSVRKIETIRDAGYYGDGGGLYLRVTATGTKGWIFRYQIAGRRRDMGLGAVDLVSLAEARRKAIEARKLIADGQDPLDAKIAESTAAAVEAAKAITFKAAAEAYIASHQAAWRNPKHAAQWAATLTTYVYPVFGELPVSAADTELVMRVLQPIWSTKSETASRVRGRIESILDWAKVRGYRDGENPARWKGHLQALLPAKAKVAKVEHHAALPYTDMPAFMAALRVTDGMAARALRFAILTAARTGEALGATWAEINLTARLWTVPAERMKAGKEHRVPLSEPAMTLLRDLYEVRQGDPVFPGAVKGRGLSNMALLMALRRLGRADLTAHGFRSTFRDWVAEQTNFPSEVAEMALAHTVGDKVEAAYRRGDLFEKRRQLAEAWGGFCSQPADSSIVTRRVGE